MKFLIVGRTGTGKDYLRSLLEDSYGWNFVKSNTTRAKRTPDEDTHIFVTQEEADNVPAEDKVAYTKINGNEYYATRQQVENCDAYIIDPIGADMLLKNMPGEWFRIVYLYPSDKEVQQEMAIKRSDDPDNELKVFNSRSEDENGQFSDFETKLKNHEFNYPNCVSIEQMKNDYSQKSMENFAIHLEFIRRFHRNVCAIVKDLESAGIMNTDDNNRVIVYRDKDSKNPIAVTVDEIADYLEIDSQMFADIIKQWLSLSSTDIPAYLTARDIDVNDFLTNIAPAVENLTSEDAKSDTEEVQASPDDTSN